MPVDSRPETVRYVEQLEADDFVEISAFLTREAARYGLVVPEAAHFQLARTPASRPPAVPPDGNRLAIGWWSLKMRWWAWRQSRQDGLPDPDIQVFMRYQSLQGSPVLDRSVGLKKGRYTLVNAFASPRASSRNRVVVAHELLHVFGASDKYDLATGQPIVPEGLAAPQAEPLFPQRKAEIMGGAIALSPTEARMPSSLAQCLVGPATAREIGWMP
jgi:hypothetical protein